MSPLPHLGFVFLKCTNQKLLLHLLFSFKNAVIVSSMEFLVFMCLCLFHPFAVILVDFQKGVDIKACVQSNIFS